MFRGLVSAAFLACIGTCFASAAYASASHTDVTISTAPTQNMVLNNGVYSPTGDGAVLNVNDLTAALNAGNLEVMTGAAPGTHPGDIAIEAAVHWVSANALTLDAFHSIRVDHPVTDAGPGALTLTTNDGGANGHLEFSARGNINFWGLANALTISGRGYRLVNSVASLAAAINANVNGNYALAASYDASVDGTYKQDPIVPQFGGSFEGLGNAISNVSMRTKSGNAGFFYEIAASASVTNFRLKNMMIFVPARQAEVQAVGGLAAESDGTLYGDEISGVVTAPNSVFLGGLVGEGSGGIEHCTSATIVRSDWFGGNSGVGGLAGYFTGVIADSIATANVRGGSLSLAVGGLVGFSAGPIRHSHATGNISAPFTAGAEGLGGLVGSALSASIVDSYATGNVNGDNQGSTGGFVGSLSGSVSRSFATGKIEFVNGRGAGGLVGGAWDGSSIANSYATGAITVWAGGSAVGGFVGGGGNNATATISNSYATGEVTGPVGIGGFACAFSEFSNDYWNTTTSGISHGECGGTDIAGVTGLTTTQLRSGLPPGFDPKIWAQDRKINHGFPYLIANPPPQ